MPAKRKGGKPAAPVPLSMVESDAPLLSLRAPQWEAFNCTERLLWLIWRRQFGKSYYFGAQALDWQMEEAGADVLIVSASIRLGAENIRKEAKVWRDVMESLQKRIPAGFNLQSLALDDKGALLDLDAIADLMESQKLETRLYHSRTTYSRSMTVAPNPDTAVGYTSHLLMDEVGRMPEFKLLWEALEPVVSSNRKLKVRGATTPPPDDSHYSYELLCPKAGEEFTTNAKGNFYESQSKMLVHRVDAWDGYAAGVPVYDLKTGDPMTPDQSRAAALDKSAWDRNYGVKFIRGGASALSMMALLNAQNAGGEKCRGVNITEQLEAA